MPEALPKPQNEHIGTRGEIAHRSIFKEGEAVRRASCDKDRQSNDRWLDDEQQCDGLRWQNGEYAQDANSRRRLAAGVPAKDNSRSASGPGDDRDVAMKLLSSRR